MSVQKIPTGYRSAVPYLAVSDGAAALAYYIQAFGAKETMRMEGPDGKIMHAEIRIGDSPIMLSDEFPEMGVRSPDSLGGSPVGLLLYVEDVDSFFQRAISAGGKELRAVQNQFYGDRSGTLEDPFGHRWSIATHVEDVSPEELERRQKELFSQGG